MGYSLSTKDELALNFIVGWIAANGYSPSVRDIADGTGVSIAVAHYRLEHLRDAGAVTWKPGSPRTLRVAQSSAEGVTCCKQEPQSSRRCSCSS